MIEVPIFKRRRMTIVVFWGKKSEKFYCNNIMSDVGLNIVQRKTSRNVIFTAEREEINIIVYY